MIDKETIEAAAKKYAELNDNHRDWRDINGSLKSGFKAGAEWLASQSQWIDVKDRLPKMIEGQNYSANVYVVSNGRLDVFCYCLITDGGKDFCAWCNLYGDINGEPLYDDDYNVTHWQPLPVLPSSPNI